VSTHLATEPQAQPAVILTEPPPPALQPTWRQSRYGLAALFFVSLLVCWFALRAVLFLMFKPDSGVPFGQGMRAFATGLHLDVFAGLLFSLPLLFWMLIVSNRRFEARWHRAFLSVGLAVFWAVQVFLLCLEGFFFEEFKSRFNTVAVDYLLYPHEVFINIWDSYPVVPFVAGCIVAGVGWMLGARWLFPRLWTTPVSRRMKGCFTGGALGLCLLLAPTIRLESIRFSPQRVINEIAGNGAVSFVTAAWSRHLDYAAFYRTMPLDEAYTRARRLLSEPNAAFTEPGQSIRRRVAGDSTRPRLNVVILLEESLGSEFWGCLGRQAPSLTPEMDRLAEEEGMLFTNLYATGNRTVRGFEGVLSSFPPLPGDSIVKRHLSENVETLARVLKRDGYDTVFVYGGRGVFDGMRAYARDNGYDRFIEQEDFAQPTFTTIWGVCDEDIFTRTLEECRALDRAGKPFFATALSVSNHKPYTYPPGRIAEDPERRKRNHAVKYSDYALGQFFRAAKREAFWTNTIFVVVADHGARVYGSQSIPIRSYEIPLLIAGPAVVKGPTRVPHLGCSLDVAPTLLGLLGRPYESLFFGRDLLQSPPEDTRILVHHNRNIGMYRDQRMVVLGLMHTVEFYRGDPKNDTLQLAAIPEASDLDLEKDATALFQVADDLYMHRRFQIDPR
jgi:phosphoglycerol transferase MdoB-like AlkP superfamily enzyme